MNDDQMPLARVTITAYPGRPPHIESTTDPYNTLKMVGVALGLIVEDIKPKVSSEPVEDKPREYLGPRVCDGPNKS